VLQRIHAERIACDMPRPDKGTRQKLLDTARDLLWTSSYGSVSVDDICKKAGVKKGSFYHYFPSKLDLALAAMEEYYQYKIEHVMTPVFAANKPFVLQIEDLAEAILRDNRASLAQYGRVCGCPLAALGSEMIGEEDQQIAKKVEEMFARCREFLVTAVEGAIAAGVVPPGDAAAKTQELHDFITGLLIMSRIHNSLDGLERDLRPGLFRILGLDATPATANQKI
jgi:TetR/AcrR family transcriptional regulator, transcriptional repressor for nem operon